MTDRTPYFKHSPGEFSRLRPAVCVIVRHPGTSDAPPSELSEPTDAPRHLMIQRHIHDVGGGFWTPVTGSCDPGEAQELACVREVLEETGLQIRPVRRVWECPNSFRTHVLHWWLADLTPDAVAAGFPVTPQAGEVDDYRWCSLADAMALTPMFDDTRYFFEQFGGDLYD